MNKKQKVSIILLIIILINYVLTRFVFFDLHQMKDFVESMSLISFALSAIFLLSDNIIASFSSSIANIIGFIVGYYFQVDTIDIITGHSNNMWLIWLITYILIVGVTFVIDKMFHMKHK